MSFSICVVLTNWNRTVKMSILALYYRIGSGVQGLPWVVQARGVWVTAGVMTAAAFASFMVSCTICGEQDGADHVLGTTPCLPSSLESLGYRATARRMYQWCTLHADFSSDQRGNRHSLTALPAATATVDEVQQEAAK